MLSLLIFRRKFRVQNGSAPEADRREPHPCRHWLGWGHPFLFDCHFTWMQFTAEPLIQLIQLLARFGFESFFPFRKQPPRHWQSRARRKRCPFSCLSCHLASNRRRDSAQQGPVGGEGGHSAPTNRESTAINSTVRSASPRSLVVNAVWGSRHNNLPLGQVRHQRRAGRHGGDLAGIFCQQVAAALPVLPLAASVSCTPGCTLGASGTRGLRVSDWPSG